MQQTNSLKSKAVHGILWSMVEKVAVRGVGFVVSIIIARMLSPDDYGLIGMLAIFLALSNMLIDSGFSQALVQKQDRTQTDFSTAFFFNIAVGIFCYLILFFFAPLVAQFYSTPELSSILRILGLGLIINSLCTVQRAKLLIKIDFKTTAKINLISTLISGITGISMAYSGFGVWALVAQTLSMQACATLFFWIFGKWLPTSQFSFDSFKRLFCFGSKLLAAGSVATILREVYSVAIGRFYHASELGFYTRAVQTTDMVSGTVSEAINAVTFPILSSIQQDRERLVAAYSKMLSMTAFVIFPVMTLLAVVAQPFVSVLLTDKWLPVVPLLQWLCFARMFTPISSLNMNILNAIGRSDLFMKLDFSKIPLTIIIMIITLPLGVNAMVIGSFISTFICYFINAYLPGKLFGFGVKAQFKIFRKILLSTLIMAVFTFVLIGFIDNSLLKLVSGSIGGVLFYYLCSKFMKITQLKDIEQIVLDLVRNNKNR